MAQKESPPWQIPTRDGSGFTKVCPQCGHPTDRQSSCGFCRADLNAPPPPRPRAQPRPGALWGWAIADELHGLTAAWTTTTLVRRYALDRGGEEKFRQEVEILGQHGYLPATQSADGGHIHAGRLLVTGGLSVFAGSSGIRSQGSITVTFARQASAPTPAPADLSGRLSALEAAKTAGLLTNEEYAAKRAAILDSA
jgi:hypothetical protein